MSDSLYMTKNFRKKFKQRIEHPPAEYYCNDAYCYKFWNHRQGHITYGSNCLQQCYQYANNYARQQNRGCYKQSNLERMTSKIKNEITVHTKIPYYLCFVIFN